MTNNTSPWNGKALALCFAEGGTLLDVRTARDDDNPARVFQISELADLWETIKGSGQAVKASNFVLYGKELKEDGKAKHVVADIQKDYVAKDGSKRKANHAYRATQIAAHEPVSFAVLTKWVKANGRNIPMPLVLCYELPYQKAVTQQALGFERKSADKPAAEPVIERKKAR